MSHFAKLNSDNIVTEVIVAEQDFINSGLVGLPSEWIQTSYNTHGGVHANGETPLRKNFAAIGYIYDAVRDAFYETQPYASWTLNETTCIWESPVTHPGADDKAYKWDEETINWVEM
jgi:hypothetical protein